MFGLITRLTAKPGQREALLELLADGLASRPGCLSYVVAAERGSDDAFWVTEVWTDEAAHKDSLAPPAIKALTTRAWAMVATVGDSVLTSPMPGPGVR